MGDYGMKVSKAGFSVLTANEQQLIFSSKYTTLRVHSKGSGTVTHTGGRIATIAHGLGYVPMFVVHADYYNSGKYAYLPITTTSDESEASCWADSTNIYVKVNGNLGYQAHFSNDSGEETSAWGYLRGAITVGHNLPFYGNTDGAIRYTLNVAKNATIYEANCHFVVSERWGSSNMYFTARGIAEDNTGDFSSDPLGRATTTHYHSPEGNPSSGSTFSFGIKDAMNDVTTRSGWASGNNFGLIIRRDESRGGFPNDNGIRDVVSGSGIYYVNGYLTTLTTDNLLNYKYTIFKDKIE